MKSFKQLGAKLGKRFKSRTFTAVFIGSTVLVLAAGTSAALTLHFSQNAPEPAAPIVAKEAESPASVAQPASVATDSAATSTAAQTPQPAATPKPVVKPAPTPVPTPAPALPHIEPSVTISADGCTVSAKADAGLVFLVGSYLPKHKGGHAGYVMPANQTLTRVGGAVAGFTIFGEIVDPATLSILAYKTMVTSTGTSCAGSNPDWTAPDLNYPLPPDAYI